MNKLPNKPIKLSRFKNKGEAGEAEGHPKLIIDDDGNIIDRSAEATDDPAAAAGSYAEERERDEGGVRQFENVLPVHRHEAGLESEPDGEKETAPRQQQTLKKEDRIDADFDVLKRELEEQVGFNISFDVVFREMVFGGTKVGIFYYNGFAKDEVLTIILERLSTAVDTGRKEKHSLSDSPVKHTVHGSEGDNTVQLFMDALLPHIQVKQSQRLSEVIDNTSTGATAFFFEGSTSALLVDAKLFPVRSTDEPDLERVVRGARDGFVETLLTNVTLLRRRIRDPRLKLEMLRAGRRTHTDICLAYIDDICDRSLIEAIRDKIKQVDVDGLPLAEKQLEEAIIGKGWNPYPMVRYSERPDVVSVHLLEGHVAIFVDTSPSVIILPTTFFHHVQHAEEYRQTPMVGTYLRWVRFFGIAASLFLLPLWLLLVTSPELKPAGLEFLGPQKSAKLPLLLQFLLAEIGTDLMRMAAVHTPSPLATAMGLVAAILVGDVAVKSGLFVNEVILYLSIAAVGTFATPSYEMSLANRLTRLALLIAAAVFKVPGLVIAASAWLVYLAVKRSYNSPYLWPFIPFNGKALWAVLVRKPFSIGNTRMSLTRPRDGTRKPVR
ncbi:spore germination protein [Paenibacillus piri]|uniref:Spore germination protein n=1 Tax=Paenibacillus piri TaxID=2547395 RepID=A0A4R5KTR1_9BACL|nr:spore germination protein [Paenibacillus piri]TDF99289.1 spore germination protein [Paenibacillus piri]